MHDLPGPSTAMPHFPFLAGKPQIARNMERGEGDVSRCRSRKAVPPRRHSFRATRPGDLTQRLEPDRLAQIINNRIEEILPPVCHALRIETPDDTLCHPKAARNESHVFRLRHLIAIRRVALGLLGTELRSHQQPTVGKKNVLIGDVEIGIGVPHPERLQLSNELAIQGITLEGANGI